MKQRECLIADVVEVEAKMFRVVPSIGGRACCQDDIKTFRIMRSSQLASWSDAVLESYLTDLEDAESSGRNLLTEKYARMMETTSPLEFSRIEHLLPPVNSRALELTEQIAAIVLNWEVELLEMFPNVKKRGRPIFRTDDRFGVTSLETYLKGELVTYSVRTLELYLENTVQQKSEGVNGAEITLRHTVKQYGLESLENADVKLKQRN